MSSSSFLTQFDSYVERLVLAERKMFVESLAAQHARAVLQHVSLCAPSAPSALLQPITQLLDLALSAVSARYDEHCALTLAFEAQRLARALHSPLPLGAADWVRDATARARWSDAFGSDAFVANVEELLLLVLDVDPRVAHDDAARIRSLIDPRHTGLCTTHTLSSFVDLFGPLEAVASVVADTYAQPWFFGFLTKRDCECHLASKPTFSFLVRLDTNAASREQALIFHICFRHDNLSIHIRIDREEKGLRIGQPVGPLHENLFSLVHEYRVWLASPCRNNFVAVPGWVHDLRQFKAFHDILTRPERRAGDFALAFSEADGNVAFAFVDSQNTVQWASAQRVVDDSLVFNRVIYSTVHEFVDVIRQRGTFVRPTFDTLVYPVWRLSTARTQLFELCVAVEALMLDVASTVALADATIASLALMRKEEKDAVVRLVQGRRTKAAADNTVKSNPG
jgi:hypothetical protein